MLCKVLGTLVQKQVMHKKLKPQAAYKGNIHFLEDG
ncbi:hypothetical protein IAD21_05148 [Abditibacteriota bacterium]|nr:hypothetical protein IAD21_05148 [Abditibacteriota bacterium]